MLASKRVLVAGLGVTGKAVVAALEGLPETVKPALVTTLDRVNPRATFAHTDQVPLADIDLIVVSPGWAPSSDLLVGASDQGIEIISEIELAWRLRVKTTATGEPAPWLGLTGTNGKTTTVQMLVAMLSASGKHTVAVGNVGTPAITAALDPTLDVLALELSSFQLHFTSTMSLHAGAVLNLAPDHLDWHGSFKNYADDKAKIFARAQVACVYNVQDSATMKMVAEADVQDGARAIGFTLGAPERGQLGLIEDVLVDRAFHLPVDTPGRHTQAAEIGTLADLAHLAGPSGHPAPHTVANALAAAALARSVGVSARAVQTGLRGFTPDGHRMTAIGSLEVSGGAVAFFDDSKATNPHAAAAALTSFADGTVVWIAGGDAKGLDLTELVAGVHQKLRGVVVIGEDQQDILHALAQHGPAIPVTAIAPGDTGGIMDRAVAAAVELARSGDTVLLAPACASMDQFVSYADRGDRFTASVVAHLRDVGQAP